jgi:hypothetical protein
MAKGIGPALAKFVRRMSSEACIALKQSIGFQDAVFFNQVRKAGGRIIRSYNPPAKRGSVRNPFSSI